MTVTSPETHTILATDLDGTLIPMEGSTQNAADLKTLSQSLADAKVPLVFVTGRHLKSILRAIDQFDLPAPAWIVADVGTSIYNNDGAGGWQAIEGYADYLQSTLNEVSLDMIRFAFDRFDELTLQADEKQDDSS